ncbi:MAG: hypothetical protein HYY09_02045 [Firmicutes bacterium]|nr:hypothetical protein [Bacillota bacterium]
MQTLTPEIYRRYRDEVFKHSLAIQEYDGLTPRRALTDAEIGARLEIPAELVTEIRCVLEVDGVPLVFWKEAESFKQVRCLKRVKPDD